MGISSMLVAPACTTASHAEIKADPVMWAECLNPRPWSAAYAIVAECPLCNSTLAIPDGTEPDDET